MGVVLSTLGCGCKTIMDGRVTNVRFCKLHDSAPELLEACKLMVDSQKVMPEMKNNFLLGSILAHCKKAVAKAEGRSNTV